MLKHTKRVLGLAVMLALPIALSADTANAQAEKSGPALCTATLDLSAVPVQPEAVVVRAAFSAPIGAAVTATVPQESGVQVVKVEPAPGPSGPAGAAVTLNTSSAVAGEWAISFEGENGTCAGKLQVAEGGALMH